MKGMVYTKMKIVSLIKIKLRIKNVFNWSKSDSKDFYIATNIVQIIVIFELHKSILHKIYQSFHKNIKQQNCLLH